MRNRPRIAATAARLLASLLALALASPAAPARSELPIGFAGIEIGAKWEDVEDRFDFQTLHGGASAWDGYAHRCGFRYVLLPAENGELLVTVNDHVVTEVVYATRLEEGSDLMAVADLIMQNYGQPRQASMRNILGQITIDREDVHSVALDYRDKRFVQFTLTGRDLWEYRISVRFDHHRWHENRTLRCARELDRAAGDDG